ncbi:MAG: proline--tRNA ligase [Planctomycetota bacterium]
MSRGKATVQITLLGANEFEELQSAESDNPTGSAGSPEESIQMSRTTTPAAVHRWSRTLIPTLREAPADATLPSHILLTRAGFIRQLAAGVYDYLPLAHRTLTKLSQIVREELDKAGSIEMLMPAMQPMELFHQTGRAEAYGDDLFRLQDRHDRQMALGPTHEEVITELLKPYLTSYKLLPLNLFQIQSKFRDEPRPRAGLLRGREFLMKDAYSFHLAVDGPGGLNETYDEMHAAYSRIFERCGLDFSAVEAEAGPIGGSASHEFMVNCDSGEDTILFCAESGYAANVEKCEIGERAHDFGGAPTGELDVVATPNCPGIDDVCAFFKKELKTKLKPANMLKSLVFRATRDGGDANDAGESWYVLAVVRGDHEINEGKLRDVVSAELGGAVTLTLAPQVEAKADGWAIGFVGPHAFEGRDDTYLVVDPDAAQPRFWVTGSNETDSHVRHFHWPREVPSSAGGHDRLRVADIRNAEAGDPSPRAAGAKLESRRGIEVGHIFKLGTKYSEAMGLLAMDENQSRQPIIMGCYGIGVSRVMAACVEMSHDDSGIIWPANLAPYQVCVTVMKSKDDAQMSQAQRVADSLAVEGIDVLVDDRDERPGVKFKDADLVGFPLRITIADKAMAGGNVEYKLRTSDGEGELVQESAVVGMALADLSG